MSSMASEKAKMLSGALYDPVDPQLQQERLRARQILKRLNDSDEESEGDAALRAQLLQQLFGRPTDAWIQPPFFCDYGTNIRLGRKVFFNFNCVLLDVAQITIGDHVLFGPAVQVYTATHPLDAALRRAGLESARPIEIGADVWVGGGAIICPGVRIGARTVIGAGSVVTRDIPPDAVAVGNPCRVLSP